MKNPSLYTMISGEKKKISTQLKIDSLQNRLSFGQPHKVRAENGALLNKT